MEFNNQSLQFNAAPTASPFMPLQHNFMQMQVPPRLLPRNPQDPHQMEGEGIELTLEELRRQNLRLFWQQQLFEINQITEIKQHQLPLARIKRVMKADEDVKMISADTPVLFAKACELFILELTLRSWFRAEDSKRRVLQRSDIAHAVTHSEVLDFLFDIVPTEEAEAKEDKSEKAEKTEKTEGGIQTLPYNNEVNFPMMDVNQFHQNFIGDLMAAEQIPQNFMFQQPSPSTQFIYEPPPQ